MEEERRLVARLRLDEVGEVGRELADRVRAREARVVRAGRGDAVTRALVRRRAARVVVALVDREHEQRVGLVDAVSGQAVEERLVGLVLLGELLDVAGAARTVGVAVVRAVARLVEVVVRVADIGHRHRDAALLHGRDVAERLCGARVEVVREPVDPAAADRLRRRARRRVGGERACRWGGRVREVEDVVDRGRQVVERVVGAVSVRGRGLEATGLVDHLVGIGRAEQAVEAGVAAGLVREHVGLPAVGGRADRRRRGAVDRDPLEIRDLLAARDRAVAGEVPLRRAVAVDLRDVPGRRRLGVLELHVGDREGADVAARARVRNPRRRRVVLAVADQVRQRVVDCYRVRPVGERGRPARGAVRAVGRAVGVEDAERVRDADAVAVRVQAGERRDDPAGRVRDQDRVVVGAERPVGLQEALQRGHLLEIGRDIRVVARQMRVVVLDVDDVLDRATRSEGARGRSCDPGPGSRQERQQRAGRYPTRAPTERASTHNNPRLPGLGRGHPMPASAPAVMHW